MTTAEAFKVVRTVLCKGLTVEQTDQILKAMVPSTAEAGALVFKEGEKGQGLLVLVSGTVEILKHDGNGSHHPIAVVEAPTVLGEMSLIMDREHSATVRARTACEFRLLSRTQFERLLAAESLAAYKIVATLAEVIARRLHRMDQKVIELSRQRDVPAPVEELAAFKQKLFSEWSF